MISGKFPEIISASSIDIPILRLRIRNRFQPKG